MSEFATNTPEEYIGDRPYFKVNYDVPNVGKIMFYLIGETNGGLIDEVYFDTRNLTEEQFEEVEFMQREVLFDFI